MPAGKVNDHPKDSSVRPVQKGTPKVSLWRHWWKFNLVSFLGIFVQLLALHCLTSWAHLGLRLSTLLAVEAAVVHNFIWHERWTWSDRTHGSAGRHRLLRLWRFNLTTGLVSLVGNVLITDFLVGWFAFPILAANLAAILTCYAANFAASEWFAFRRLPIPAKYSPPDHATPDTRER